MRVHSSEHTMVECSHDLAVPVECGKCAASAILGKEEVASSSGLKWEVQARSSRAMVSPLNSGAAAASLLTQSPLRFPLLETKGFHFDEKFNQSDFPPILLNGELSSDGVNYNVKPCSHSETPSHKFEVHFSDICQRRFVLSSDGVNCHNVKPYSHLSSETPSHKFEVHFSDICQRRFVMFDQSGSEKRMIFHPSMLHEFPELLESPLEITNRKKPTLLGKTRSEHLKDILVSPLLSDDCASLDAVLPPGWRSTLLTSREEDVLSAAYRPLAGGCSEDRIPDCISKENTEDLDALLWSDDEMSSIGHFPSWSDAYAVDSKGCSAYFNKKRKACLEAETDSTATSGNSTPRKVFCGDAQHLGSGSGYGKEEFTVFDLSSADEESSNGSTNTQRQHQVQSSAHMRLVKKTKKNKIQSTFQLLRSLIPGGEAMDAGLVLSEAVQYVKNLQVEVEKVAGNEFP